MGDSLNFGTLGDMLDYYYGSKDHPSQYSGYRDFEVRKDANVTSSVTGAYNPVYGAQVFAQFNLVANTLGILPKFPMPRTGVRVATAPSSTSGTGGVGEDGTIPDTAKPTLATFSRKPKEVAHSFSVSNRQELISKMEDDAPINMAWLRQYWGEEHPKQVNYMLNTDVTTLAGSNVESLDRVVSSYAEVTNCGDVDAGDSDIYGNDRDAAASWADAYVNHNSNTDRTLTLSLVRTVIRTTRAYRATPTVILTGPTTAQKLDELIDAQSRYTVVEGTGIKKAHLTSNGVKTDNGLEGGFEVATLFGLPVIEDADVVVDGAARLYVLDTTSMMGMPKLGMALAQPTSYYEYGMSRGDPSGINRLGTEGLYYTSAELHCSVFRHQGKIRDISA